MELKICHVYPDLLNLYGDRGNLLCLRRRLEWRGIGCSVTEVPLGQPDSFADYDLLFLGGGQDFEQKLLLEDLQGGKADSLRSAVADGKTFLAICGGYQLLGHYYQMADGSRCGYLGALDLYTVAGTPRLIGNTACRSQEAGVLLGFENHGGRSYLGADLRPLGQVLAGGGNNGRDGGEGTRYKNVFASYYHGPLLPKNPALCDVILQTALTEKYGSASLEPLPDLGETAARQALLARLKLRPLKGSL